MSGSETDKVKLLPCPFCDGSLARIWSPPYGGYSVICGHACGAEGPIMESDGRAAEAWNRRALSAAQGEITRYREAMEKRLVAGHNDTCELMLIKGDPMATCTCGHNAIGAALSPPSQQEIQR